MAFKRKINEKGMIDIFFYNINSNDKCLLNELL